MTQTCKYKSPLPVFLGSIAGLLCVTTIGVIGGQAIHQILPVYYIRWAAAFTFLILGILIFRNLANDDVLPDDANCQSIDDIITKRKFSTQWNRAAFLTSFILLFLYELGDKTQLAIVGIASQNAKMLPVLIGGSLALIGSTAIGVLVGKQLNKYINQKVLTRISGSLFILIGVVIIAQLLLTSFQTME